MVAKKPSACRLALTQNLAVGVLFALSLFLSGFPYVVAIEALQDQTVVVSGTLSQEVFTPACRTLVPACMAPSFVEPILLARNNTIYSLTSDDITLKQELLTENGTFVIVTGLFEPFNASTYNVTFTCSPYPCGAITVQISVISLEQVTYSTTTYQTSTTVSQTSTPSTQPVSGFEIPSILIGLTLGVVAVARRRKAERSRTFLPKN